MFSSVHLFNSRSIQISVSSCINVDSIREIISICAWKGLFMKGKQQAGTTNYELSLVGGIVDVYKDYQQVSMFCQ